jgi:hypothetical protein
VTIPREFISIGDGEMVQTKYGPVRIVANGKDTFYIDAQEVTVRGVTYNGSFHTQDYGQGMEITRHASGFYLSRKGSFSTRDVSDAARRALSDEFLRVAREYAATEQGRAALAEGARIQKNNDAHSLETEIGKLEQALLTKWAELGKLVGMKDLDERWANFPDGKAGLQSAIWDVFTSAEEGSDAEQLHAIDVLRSLIFRREDNS